MPRLIPPEIVRLDGAAQQRLADVTAQLNTTGPTPMTPELEGAIRDAGAALARLARARRRLRLTTRAGGSVTSWLREQRVVPAPTGAGFEVLAREHRGPKRGPQGAVRLQALRLGAETLAAALARSATAQLALPDTALLQEHRVVRLPEIAAFHGLSEDELLERWRRVEGRRASGWPTYYGNGDWGLPLPVLTDQVQFLARVAQPEPPHFAPLPEGFET